MKFTHEMTYAASPEEVFAMITDSDFRTQVCEYQRVLRHSVSVEDTDEGVVVDVVQVQSTEFVPASARSLLGDEIEIEQRETWHSPTDATLLVTIPGKPGRMDAVISLREVDGGTLETVTGEITVSIPLLGRKLEGMVSQVFGFALDAEQRVGETWLAGE